MSGVLIKRRNLDTDTQQENTNEGRDASTNQGTPEVVRKLPEATRKAWNRFSLTTFGSKQPCWHLILDF